jgi:hypothetical protein
MPSSTWRRESSEPGPRLLALWTGVLAGPFAWAALLQTNYVMSYVACEYRHTWMLHLTTVLALAVTVAGGLSAWRAVPVDDGEAPPSRAVARARDMAMAGLALSVWFALVILATEIPVLMLPPCTP